MSKPCCDYVKTEMARHKPKPKKRIFVTTRSNASEDAHRDMDGFDLEEELARLRLAIQAGTLESMAFAREAFNNIDEHLVRHGELPKSWSYHACPNPEAHHKKSVVGALKRCK